MWLRRALCEAMASSAQCAPQDRVDAIERHASWQLRGAACIIGGFVVIYRNKILFNRPHFKSLHGKVSGVQVLPVESVF
jgi:hypothetical protein